MNSRLSLRVLLVALLFCAQLAWWGVLLWRQGEGLHRADYRAAAMERRAGQMEWRQAVDQGEPAADAWRRLASSYPALVYVPAAAGDEIQIHGRELGRLDARLTALHVMVFGEGAFFLLLAGLALGLLLRTVRQQQRLALQESNFLHAVTHEFRSPLQSLRLAVESLLRRSDPPRVTDYAQGMLEDVTRLDALVENVLAVGRLDARAFAARPRPLALSEALAAALASWRSGCRADPSWLHADIQPDLHAEADPAALEPILRNLLDNAYKYGEGRPVNLSLEEQGAYVLLRVRDQGRGFRAEDRPHLFQRFWRAGDERVRTAPGVGLGLYLVAELARAQGAAVSASSPGPGRGAEFTVRWPRSPRP